MVELQSIGVRSGRLLRCAAPAILAAAIGGGPALADNELNVSFARQNSADAPLFANFVKDSGIRVNLVDIQTDDLAGQLRAGGQSPVDVLVTVDVGRLWPLEEQGVFQPVSSPILKKRVPAHLRHPEDLWFGFSTRARVIYYDPATVAEPPATYEALAEPRYRGMLCVSPGRSMYNVSLLAFMVAQHGTPAAEAWARGVVGNFARSPRGGDSAQIAGVAAGECGIAVANHYYFVRMQHSDRAEQRDAASKVTLVWPNQDGDGTQVNITGGGVVRNAKNRENAVRFLEYLTTETGQHNLSERAYAYPVVAGASRGEALEALGPFRQNAINVSVYGSNQSAAREIIERVGWQ